MGIVQYLHIFDFSISGKKAYTLNWGLQYVNLLVINIGYLIFTGQAL